MLFQKRLLSLAVASCMSAVPLLLAEVHAEEKQSLEKITVTGSHIKRTDVEGALPLVTLDAEAIKRSGAGTVSELLRGLTLNNGASFDGSFALSFAPGSSGVSLRGLGQDGTLILLNGRRIANHGFALEGTDTFVDLNSLPLAAIERIEVLKDGASATYGSDALAGVINIITRKNMSNVEVSTSYGLSDNLDANEMKAAVVGGYNTSNMNLTVAADYFKREAVNLGDRAFSESADHTGKTNGIDKRSPAAPESSVFDPFGGTFLKFSPYNPNPNVSVIPASERMGAVADFRFDITPNISLFAEAMLRNVNTTVELPPTPYNTFVLDTNSFNTYGQHVVPVWRMSEAGNRTYDIDTNVQRVVGGLEGSLKNWDWESSAIYNVSTTTMTGTNFIDQSKIDAAVTSETINPFGTTTNAAADIDALKLTTKRTGTYKLYEAGAKASSSVFELSSGEVLMAVGASARHESLSDVPDDNLQSGNVVGTGGTEAAGYRRVSAGFAEIIVPVTEAVEVTLAGRHEQYSDFGGTTNPKLALRYQPMDILLLRASVGTGFKAPSLAEMHAGKTTNFEYLIDTERCAVTTDPVDCNTRQIQVDLAGNPDLEPEKSQSISLGLVADLKPLEIAIDYWYYKHTDIISADTQYMLDHEADYSGSINRNPPAGGTPGAITSIDGSYYNFAQRKTSGVDVDATYRFTVSGRTEVSFSEQMSFTNSYQLKRTSDDDFEELVGSFRFPNMRNRVTLGVKSGALSAHATLNYIHSYKDVTFELDGHSVNSYSTIDLQTSYQFFKYSEVIAGMENVLDTDPPYSTEYEGGFDIATHNPRGRFAYLTLKHTF